MTSWMGFCRILRNFSHSVRMDVSAHFSALDDEEFFVIEGSGWRGRRRCSATRIRCIVRTRQDRLAVSLIIRTTHTPPPHHHRSHHQTSQVHMVSAMPFGFLRLLGLNVYGLHGSEGAGVSSRHLDAFRIGIVRACWPKKMPMANPLALRSLLDAPDGCDPAYYVIWSRPPWTMRVEGSFFSPST